MLEQGKRLFLRIFIIGVFVLQFSCSSDLEIKSNFFSEQLKTTQAENSMVYRFVSDTIKKWIDLDLAAFHQFRMKEYKASEWKIDWIFFNSRNDRCQINMLLRVFANETQDDVYFILGEKQAGKWWFYQGPDLVIIQSVYDDDPDVLALPFSTLSQIARKNTLSWYYIEKPSGTCLKKLFSEGYDSYKKCSDEKYIINDQYFEDEFNYRPSFELRQKDYRERFLKNIFVYDSTQLNQ